MIGINQPIYGPEEMTAVNDVFNTGLFTVSAYSLDGGPHVKRFEKKLTTKTFSKHAIATSSGTAALETALLAFGIGHRDKVIVPSLTFVATANAIRSVGAEPVFCDVSDNGLLDYDHAKKLSKMEGVRCIIFVDLYGRVSPRMESLKGLVDYVIEDSCQALGSPKAGTMGDIGCFSFYASKVITTMGLGGACVTNNNMLAERLKLARNQGILDGECIGYGRNNLMGEANAAFGCTQLDKLDSFIKQRHHNMKKLGMYENTNGYMATILLENRDEIKKKLNDLGIGAATYYDKPIHKHSAYDEGLSLPITERISKQVLNLPVHPNVTSEAIETMRKIINEN